MRNGVEKTSSLNNVCWDYVSIGTADFQPIEIFVRYDVDDVAFPIIKDQFFYRFQTVLKGG